MSQVLNVRCNACDRSVVGVSVCDSKCEGRKDCGLRPVLATQARLQEAESIIRDLIWTQCDCANCNAARKWLEKFDG